MRKFLFALVVGLLVTVWAAPANADTTGNTTVTFTVTSGALSITVPAAATLGSVAPGETASGKLGPVTVLDARAALAASWTASVTSSVFTGTVSAQTIATSNVSYLSGTATATVGTGTFTPGQTTTAQTLDTSRTAYTLTAGRGNNSATWNPTLSVKVPDAAVGDVYTGTITHSVA